MTEELKTVFQWAREARHITKGARAEFFLVDDDHVNGRALFRRDQTLPAGAPDESDEWTTVISVDEWEEIKAAKKDLSSRPYVRVRAAFGGGTEVWCGPDRDIIGLLRQYGYRYQPVSHYWRHPNKDPQQVAHAFEQGKVRGLRPRVKFDHPVDPGPDAPVL